MGPETLNDLGPNVIVLVLGMYSCPDAADRNCLRPGIAEIEIRQSPGRKVVNMARYKNWVDGGGRLCPDPCTKMVEE